ncbi:DinB family protein [Actinoplanes sp. NBC_00393]|uniref:hypothetical protein n=1 Tax=Actinoplanes sp. NBC_00393 TaxID=2975953 RepID=UPI002E1B1DD3
MPETPDESFVLEDSDTIASIRRAHREACAAAREATARELARHCGHADILREQILIRPE